MPILGNHADILFREDPQLNWMGNSPIRALVSLHVFEDTSQRVWLEWRAKHAKKTYPIVIEAGEFRTLILYLARKLGFRVEEAPIYKLLGKRGPWDHDTFWTPDLWRESVVRGLTMQGYWEWVAERKHQEEQ